MAEGFQGPSEISLDAKGRLAVPTRYRDRILEQGGGQVVVTAHPHGCLLLYPAPLWQPIARKVMALPSMDPKVAALQQLLVGHADEVEMDTAGRVLVSPTLRRLAGIERELVMFGQVTHFRLWNPDLWAAELEKYRRTFADALPAGTETLSLL